jgi:hypothetical protein
MGPSTSRAPKQLLSVSGPGSSLSLTAGSAAPTAGSAALTAGSAALHGWLGSSPRLARQSAALHGWLGSSRGWLGSSRGWLGSSQGWLGSSRGWLGSSRGWLGSPRGSPRGWLGSSRGWLGSSQGRLGSSRGWLGSSRGWIGSSRGWLGSSRGWLGSPRGWLEDNPVRKTRGQGASAGSWAGCAPSGAAAEKMRCLFWSRLGLPRLSVIWVAHKVRRHLPTNAFKGSKYLLLRCDPEVATPRDEKNRSAIGVCSQTHRFRCWPHRARRNLPTNAFKGVVSICY